VGEFPLALSDAAKVEPQRGQAGLQGSLGGAIDHLIVHRAAM
jgi:hypothetical protein